MWVDLILQLNQRYDWTPVMWVGNQTQATEEMVKLFPNSLVYSHEDALCARPPTSDDLELTETLSEERLRYISRHEAIFYEMMNRWCVAPDRITYEDRRHYFLKICKIWYNILLKLDADLVVCPTSPHRLYDYAAYFVARHLGVKFLFLDDIFDLWIGEDGQRKYVSFVADNLEDRTVRLKEEFQNQPTTEPSEGGRRHLELSRRDYKEAMPSYYLSKVVAESRPKPLWRRTYDKLPLEVKGRAHLIRNAINGQGKKIGKLSFPASDKSDNESPVLGRYSQALKRHSKTVRAVKRAEEWYQRSVEVPDYSKPYVYLAPHFQPERTTTPDAGLYQHTELIVETLAAALPAGWRIYYKEHPSNFRRPIRLDNVRNVAYYETLRHLAPQIVFVDVATDPFLLIDNAKAVATARGTSGWQAITRDKPALVFGDAWYSHCPGAFRIASIEELRTVFRRLPSLVIDPVATAAYVAAAERCSWDLHFRRDVSLMEIRQTDPEAYRRAITDHADAFGREFNRLREPEEAGFQNNNLVEVSK